MSYLERDWTLGSGLDRELDSGLNNGLDISTRGQKSHQINQQQGFEVSSSSVGFLAQALAYPDHCVTSCWTSNHFIAAIDI